MTNDYSAIVEKLKEQVNNFRQEAVHNKKYADEAQEVADRCCQEALEYDRKGEKNKALECRNDEGKCLEQKTNLINIANTREELANKWEKLAKDIEIGCSDVLRDIEKLENFLKKECDKNDCDEIRLLIQNHVLKEFDRYKILLQICK